MFTIYYIYFDYLNIVYRTFYPIKHHLSVNYPLPSPKYNLPIGYIKYQ